MANNSNINNMGGAGALPPPVKYVHVHATASQIYYGSGGSSSVPYNGIPYPGVTGTITAGTSTTPPPMPTTVRVDPTGVIDLTEVKGQLTIRTQDGDINLSRLAAMMSRMEYLICALETALEVTPNDPQLEAAYREFRMVEELTR